MSCTVQLAPTERDAELQVSLEILNSAALVPATLIVPNVAAALPELAIVNVVEALIPAVTPENEAIDGEKESTGLSVPVIPPVSDTEEVKLVADALV